jgi:hypothetical protein
MARAKKTPNYRERKEARQLKRKLKAVQKQRDQIAANKQYISLCKELAEDAADEGGEQ